MKMMELPAAERPREKLLTAGPCHLSDAELLAIFLRVGHRGCSAVELARSLLNHFEGLRGLMSASTQALQAPTGMGPAKAAQLAAVLELARRHFEADIRDRDLLNAPAEAKALVRAHLRDRMREVFAVLFLDSQHRLIAFEELFQGTINRAHVHTREVVVAALEHAACAVIVAHNHPSGAAEPSTADRSITRRLQNALALVDIQLIDHLVVGEADVVSFAERGLI